MVSSTQVFFTALKKCPYYCIDSCFKHPLGLCVYKKGKIKMQIPGLSHCHCAVQKFTWYALMKRNNDTDQDMGTETMFWLKNPEKLDIRAKSNEPSI